MKIRHFWYNAFIIEDKKVKIAIDPGQNLWLFKLGSLIPKSEWSSITHILVTHGDPDHYWNADRVAEASKAPLICGKQLVKQIGSEIFLLAPRGRGVQYPTRLEKVYPIDVGESVTLDGVGIEGLKTVHGPIVIRLLGLRLEQKPGHGERVGLGSIGFKISLDNKVIVNLGDSLLQKEWEGLKPDLLMIPIGGLGGNVWTMSVTEALEAVKLISPKKVVPCHYNAAFLWMRNAAPADDQLFKSEVEKMGIECTLMKSGDEIVV